MIDLDEVKAGAEPVTRLTQEGLITQWYPILSSRYLELGVGMDENGLIGFDTHAEALAYAEEALRELQGNERRHT